MSSQTVQFRNVEDIIAAYQERDIAPFGIFGRDQLFIDYEDSDIDTGAEKLSYWLNILLKNKSAGIYTVRVYKKISKEGITNKTPYNGSFNFQLTDQITGYGTTSHLEPLGVSELRSEVAALKVMMERLLESEEEMEEEVQQGSDVMGKIGAFMKQPFMEPILIPLAQKIGEAIANVDFKKKPEGILKPMNDERTA